MLNNLAIMKTLKSALLGAKSLDDTDFEVMMSQDSQDFESQLLPKHVGPLFPQQARQIGRGILVEKGELRANQHNHPAGVEPQQEQH